MAVLRGARSGCRARAAVVGGACVVVLPLASLLATARIAAADAVGVECSAVASWSFSTLLDEGFRTGTIGATYFRAVCTGASDISGRLSTEIAAAKSWSVSYAFEGSCVLTAFTYPFDPLSNTYNGSGLLVGGAIALVTTGAGRTNGLSELAVLAPSTPCAEATALGSAHFTIVATPRIMG